MNTLETVEITRDTSAHEFRFPVQYVNRPNLDFRGFAGTVALGEVAVGDEILALPSGTRSSIKDIVTFDGSLSRAYAGQAVTLTLNDEIDISRGNMLVKVGEQPLISRRIRATVVWMNEQQLSIGKLYNIKLGTQTVPAKVVEINYRIDVNTLEHHQVEQLELNAIAEVIVEFDKAVVFDRYQESRATGSFIFIDRLTNVTIAAGMVEDSEDWQAQHKVVTASDRAARLGQRPAVAQVSASIIAQAEVLESVLLQQGIVAIVRADLTADQVALIAETGILVVTDDAATATISIASDELEQVVNQLVEQVRL